ncbi:unnamed protein product [Fraxinus pennsylvanica]|uniref:Retrotransposon Copia-like N-terminal domain-containing protein n=1 Tax=Fraxinus pennsylvanica TaxID=56036 RepID=A0AAD1YM10_9LAMI|nr:unnamed protein product [Fraxinus pennsylvanica]
MTSPNSSPENQVPTIESSFHPVNTAEHTPNFSFSPQPQPSQPINSANQLAIVRLDYGNFLIWRQHVLTGIHDFRLLRFIDGSTICPPELTSTINGRPGSVNLDYVFWHRQDQLIFSWLLASMTENIQAQMVGSNTT